MNKVSSSTFYYKKLFPTLWFGIFVAFLVSCLAFRPEGDSLFIFTRPILLAAFVYVLFKKMIWDLADEVFDHGNSLEFHKGKKSDVFPSKRLSTSTTIK